MKRNRSKKLLPSHKPWRSTTDTRDDFVIRIYGWGRMRDYVRGYNVRFPRSHAHAQKYFSVKRLGSEQAALDAARAYRDKLFAKSGEPQRRTGKQRRLAPYYVKPRANNTSGMIGVTRDRGFWIAWYHPSPGVQKRRSWAVKKYTDEGARQLAILWRSDMLRSLK